MTDGTSQGLFIVVAIVIFGIFTLMAYILFEDTLSPALASMFGDAIEQTLIRTDRESVNLIDTETLTYGQWINLHQGITYLSNAEDAVTGFIPIEGNVEYIFRTPNYTSMTVAYYDSNFDFLIGEYAPSGSKKSLDLQSPENATYARISARYQNTSSSPVDTWWFGKKVGLK